MALKRKSLKVAGAVDRPMSGKYPCATPALSLRKVESKKLGTRKGGNHKRHWSQKKTAKRA